MQATSFAPFPNCCYSIPNHFHFQHPHLKRPKPVHLSLSNNQNHFTNIFALTLIPTIIATKQQEKNNNPNPNSNSNPNPNPDPNLNPSFVPQFYSCIATNKGNNQNPESQNQGKEEDHRDNQTKKAWGIFTNMWWAELKAAMGQRFNFEAIVSSAMVVVKDRHLALPHVAVPDISYIDWAELHRRGFRGVVFDKDNTITAPYSLNLWGPLRSSLEQCKSVFGPDIAVFSNSAGLCEYDLDGSKARALEGAIGIKVIRHRVKKPAGTAEEIEKHFGCKSSQLIMVGDRPLTDIVYGNRNGFLTILTEPLSLAEEPFIVRQVRKLETSLVNRWFRRGLKPTSHSLLSDAMLCVKALPPS